MRFVPTTLDATEVVYEILTSYTCAQPRSIRWDDTFHGVARPGPANVMAPRDRDYPDVDISPLQELRGL